MTLSGSFGTLSFGRMPIFGSVLGANGLFRAIEPLFANYTTGFSTSNATASVWTRVDNAISYKTPTCAGFTGYAMYSLQNDSVAGTKVGSTEGKSSTDRYASVALRYLNNRFEAVFVADTTNWGSIETHKGYNDSENVDDGYTYTLGGNSPRKVPAIRPLPQVTASLTAGAPASGALSGVGRHGKTRRELP